MRVAVLAEPDGVGQIGAALGSRAKDLGASSWSASTTRPRTLTHLAALDPANLEQLRKLGYP